jgi:hypothetical protein
MVVVQYNDEVEGCEEEVAQGHPKGPELLLSEKNATKDE